MELCSPVHRGKVLLPDHKLSSISSAAFAEEYLGDDELFRVLPEDVTAHCLEFLDVKSLVAMRAVNHRLQNLASTNGAGWENLCQKLWSKKIFVAKAARQLTHDRMTAYKVSLQDAKVRQHVTMDEIVFDEETMTGTVWSFRFKESAGPDWTSWDPWHLGQPARQMVFLRDGSVKSVQWQDDACLSEPVFSSSHLLDPPVSMSWRFAGRPMDMPDRPQGSYVRFTVSGREVPTYVVRRSPTGNWGFMMESCWGVYVSFPMPQKRICAGNQQQSVASQTNAAARAGILRNPAANSGMRLRRTSSGTSVWVPVGLEENDDDDDTRMPASVQDAATKMETEEVSSDDILRDESSFIITNEKMWREALLYNFGAQVLPEGDDGVDFDRIMGNIVHPHRTNT